MGWGREADGGEGRADFRNSVLSPREGGSGSSFRPSRDGEQGPGRAGCCGGDGFLVEVLRKEARSSRR